ncbi:MAG: glycosyltransferase family 39 protein [Planctomycetes bacterium]|nr:glycosyltransferase family 39 protein [Planctomycetota bacterium]
MDSLGRIARRIDPLLLGVVALAFGLRVQGIADDGYWLDEMTSLRDAARPLSRILAGKGGPSHPPLYYVLLKGWIALFGSSETAVRMLSAIFGTATVGAAFALFRALHGRAAGLGAALLLAVSFHHVVFSQEARMYALFCLLAVLSALTLWRAIESGGRRRWIHCIACAVLMVYTHHLACAVFLGLAAAALLAAATGRLRPGALKGFAVAAPAVLLAAVPSAFLYVFGGKPELGYGFWQPYWSMKGLGDVAALWVPGTPLAAPGSYLYSPNPPQVPPMPWLTALLALPAALLALSWARGRGDAPSPRPPPVLFHGAALYIGLASFVAIAIFKPIWHVRYVFVLLPLYLGGLAALLAALRTTRVRVAALAVAVALSLPGLVQEKRLPGRTPWRETAAFLRELGNEPVFLLGSRSARSGLGWYYKGRIEHYRDRGQFVAAVVSAAQGGGAVLTVTCGAHGPPDPANLAPSEIAQAGLRLRMRQFGPLRVYEYEKQD